MKRPTGFRLHALAMHEPDTTADDRAPPRSPTRPAMLIAVAAVEVVVFLAFGLVDGRWSALGRRRPHPGLVGTAYVCLRVARDGDQDWEEAGAIAASRRPWPRSARARSARGPFATIAADAVRTLAEARDLSLVVPHARRRRRSPGRPRRGGRPPGQAAARDIGVDQIEHTLTEGRPVVSDDLATRTRFDATALVEHGMRSCMTALVLFPDGTPYGVIAAYSDRPGELRAPRTSTSSRPSPTSSRAHSRASRRRPRCSTARCTIP